jgi:hypothetical protein
MSDLFTDLQNHFGVKPDHRGWCAITCPFCGKERRHCAFSDRGFKCVVCGAHGGLRVLADRLDLHVSVAYTLPPPKPKPVVPWLTSAAARVARDMRHPCRNDFWPQYKPLACKTLDRWQFGYGTLPFERHGEWYESASLWLTVPLFENGAIVGLRGRNTGTTGPKWISATGTHYVLWGVDAVQPGATVWITENYVDAAWLMERHPDQCAVAIGGATTWQSAWGDALAAKQPGLVIVALDNDLAGQATGATQARLRAEWHAAHPELPEPTTWLAGPRIANDLLARGLSVRLYQWPAHAPDKAGVDWLLQQE